MYGQTTDVWSDNRCMVGQQTYGLTTDVWSDKRRMVGQIIFTDHKINKSRMCPRKRSFPARQIKNEANVKFLFATGFCLVLAKAHH